MLRILAFFLVVLAAGIGFVWLAERPGEFLITWQGRQVETSFLIFVIAEIVLIAAILLLVWLLVGFFKAPNRIERHFRNRRRDRGYKALSTGIIAAGAGDSMLARRMTKRSAKLLGSRNEPLLRFLDAQTAMIEGDHKRARSVLETMERDPETKLLALRGLYLEAERQDDAAAARHYAERATRIAPHVPWAGGAVLEAKSLEGDYDGALEILSAQKDSHLIGREDQKRLRAVLLTGKAMTIAEADPAGARTAAVEAHKLAPDLAPAAVTAAQALFRLGELRRGSKILEKSWMREPHPDIATTYVHARPGDSTADRLKRAKTLQSIRPNHAESSLAVAQAALEAGDLKLARDEAMAAIRTDPRESAFLLLADIEEADTANEGRVREWLARAIRAPRDPAWTADGFVSENWSPASPVTGRLDAFRWKVPVERLGHEPSLADAQDMETLTIDVHHPPAAERKAGDEAAVALAATVVAEEERGHTPPEAVSKADAGQGASLERPPSERGADSRRAPLTDSSGPDAGEQTANEPAPKPKTTNGNAPLFSLSEAKETSETHTNGGNGTERPSEADIEAATPVEPKAAGGEADKSRFRLF